MANQTKEIFEQFVNETGVEVTYDEFTAEMDAIMNMEDVVARDKRMMSFYTGITSLAATSAIVRRGLMSWATAFNAQYIGKVHVNSVLTEIAVTQLLDSYCKEKNFDYKCEQKMGKNNEEYVQFLSGIANSVTMAKVQREFFKKGNEEMFGAALNEISYRFAHSSKGYVYSPSLGQDEDKNIAEGYAVYEHLKDIQDKKRLRDIFRHPIIFFQTRSALKAMEETFRNVGFNINEHGADAKEMMEEMPDHATVLDFNAIEDYTEERQRQIQQRRALANVEKINFACPKYEKAVAEEQKGGPDSALAKANAIYAKYGKVCVKDSDGLPNLAHPSGYEKNTATSFDSERSVEAVGDYMKHCFYVNLSNMVKAACQQVKDNGGKINVSEIMKDASECSHIMYEKFTIIFDAKETKELAKNSTFGTFNTEKLTSYVQKFLTEEGQIDRYNPDELRAEIENTVSSYVNPLSKKAMEEDVKLSETEASEPNNIIEDNQPDAVNEAVNSDETKEEQVKWSITVNLKENLGDVDEKQERISDKTLIKDDLSV